MVLYPIPNFKNNFPHYRIPQVVATFYCITAYCTLFLVPCPAQTSVRHANIAKNTEDFVDYFPAFVRRPPYSAGNGRRPRSREQQEEGGEEVLQHRPDPKLHGAQHRGPGGGPHTVQQLPARYTGDEALNQLLEAHICKNKCHQFLSVGHIMARQDRTIGTASCWLVDN